MVVDVKAEKINSPFFPATPPNLVKLQTLDMPLKKTSCKKLKNKVIFSTDKYIKKEELSENVKVKSEDVNMLVKDEETDIRLNLRQRRANVKKNAKTTANELLYRMRGFQNEVFRRGLFDAPAGGGAMQHPDAEHTLTEVSSPAQLQLLGKRRLMRMHSPSV